MSPSLYSQQAPETQSSARVELFLCDRVINQLGTIGLISAQSFAPFGCVARLAYLVFPSISIAWSSVVFFHLNLLHRSVIFKIKTKIEMKKIQGKLFLANVSKNIALKLKGLKITKLKEEHDILERIEA